jgi:outer membrane lipoprotein-sorting protein
MFHGILSYLTTALAGLAAPASAPATTSTTVTAARPALITPAAKSATKARSKATRPAQAPAPVASEAPDVPSVTRGWTWLGSIGAVSPVAAPATTGTRVAAAPSADEVVGKVQAFYATINHLTAKFRQEFTNATFGDKKVSDGSLWIMKPGKMRWDYYSKARKGEVKVEKSFISNGTYLYVVEHQNKQVIKKNLQKDLTPVAVSFLYGKGDLRSDFNAALDTSGTYGAKGDLVLKLTPKLPSAQYKTLFLVVDSNAFRVKDSIIVDSANNVNHFRFFEPDTVKAVQDTWFEFNEKSVKNYRMVDADQQQRSAPAGGGPAVPAR